MNAFIFFFLLCGVSAFVYTRWAQNVCDGSIFISPYSILILQAIYQKSFHLSSHMFLLHLIFMQICKNQLTSPFLIPLYFSTELCSTAGKRKREKHRPAFFFFWFSFIANGAAAGHPYAVQAKRM